MASNTRFPQETDITCHHYFSHAYACVGNHPAPLSHHAASTWRTRTTLTGIRKSEGGLQRIRLTALALRPSALPLTLSGRTVALPLIATLLTLATTGKRIGVGIAITIAVADIVAIATRTIAIAGRAVTVAATRLTARTLGCRGLTSLLVHAAQGQQIAHLHFLPALPNGRASGRAANVITP